MDGKFVILAVAIILFVITVIQEIRYDKPPTNLAEARKSQPPNVPEGCSLVISFNGYGGSFERLECKKSDPK